MHNHTGFLLTFVLLFCLRPVNAQVVNRHNLSVQGGVMDFSSSWLNNPKPHNKRISALSQIEYSAPLSKFLSSYANLAIGHIKNSGAAFPPETGSDFFRIGFGLLLNPNNGTFFLNDKPKAIEPYGIIGYNFDRIEKNPEAGYRKTISSLSLGAGVWFNIAERLHLGYRYTLNQKLGQDYRTFNQHTFGLMVSLTEL